MSKNVCSKCIEDDVLKTIIQGEGESGFCDACALEQQNTITIERLGELLEPVLRRHLRQGAEVHKFSADDDDDNGYYEQEGDDLGYFVQEFLGQYFSFNDDIVDAVIDAEDCWPPDGDIPFFENTASYVHRSAREYDRGLWLEWLELIKQIKGRRRFFNIAAKSFFDFLFQDVDQMRTWNSETRQASPVARVLPIGSTMYRSRICDSDAVKAAAFNNPYAEVGPTPPEKARAGRMNADGIPMFYGSLDHETSRAELRPALSSEVATITVKTTEELRVLDFTQMGKAFKPLSYFQEDYDAEVSRVEFMRRLAKLISQPVIPGNEAEYLITQTMMEYLAYVHDNPFDGVIFSSAQRAEGSNVVLFAKDLDDNRRFPLAYEENSLSIHAVGEIKYVFHEQFYHLNGANIAIDSWEIDLEY